MRSVTILGATGSIGQSTLDLIGREPEAYNVVGLSGHSNIAQLAADARRFKAKTAVTSDPALYGELKAALAGSDVEAAAGPEAVIELAERPSDWVMSAIIGAAGLMPGLRVLEKGGRLALANKETLVAAGPLVMAKAAAHGGVVLPVDSEHSAIFQALTGEDIDEVERVIITASGGAFRDATLAEMAAATPEQASKHPNWAMGQRITIDSASMFNKALEMIEAREFFGFAPEQIEVLVHPESLVHALVGFRDGALMAHLGAPDMRHAIGYALNYPERRALPVQRLDLAAIGQMTFRAPDETRWPALRLAREVMGLGGYAGAAFNAAKERALDRFLAKEIGFLQMSSVVEQVLEQLDAQGRLAAAEIEIEAVLEIDAAARELADWACSASK